LSKPKKQVQQEINKMASKNSKTNKFIAKRTELKTTSNSSDEVIPMTIERAEFLFLEAARNGDTTFFEDGFRSFSSDLESRAALAFLVEQGYFE
jgi:hypothetical protein